MLLYKSFTFMRPYIYCIVFCPKIILLIPIRFPSGTTLRLMSQPGLCKKAIIYYAQRDVLKPFSFNMFGISFVMLCKSTIICAHMRLFHYKLYISLIFHTILLTPTLKHLSFSCFFGLCLFSILVSQLRNSFRIYTHTNTLRHIYRMLYLVVPIKPFCCSLSHLNPIHDE